MSTQLIHFCRKAISIRVATVATAAVFFAGCGEPALGPEQQLRDWVARGEAAIESKDRSRLLKMVSASYADKRQNDRVALSNKLRAYFFRQNSIELLTSIDEIRLFGETAAEIDLTIGSAGTNDDLLGFSANAYRFRFELEVIDDDWQLTSARWARMGQELQ